MIYFFIQLRENPISFSRYNINETDFHIYSVSKLKKFIERVKFMMQDTLRFLVQDSCQNYVRLVTDACIAVLQMQDDFKWPQNDLINSAYKFVSISFRKIRKKNIFFLQTREKSAVSSRFDDRSNWTSLRNVVRKFPDDDSWRVRSCNRSDSIDSTNRKGENEEKSNFVQEKKTNRNFAFRTSWKICFGVAKFSN